MSFICNWLELGFAKSSMSLKLLVYPCIIVCIKWNRIRECDSKQPESI